MYYDELVNAVRYVLPEETLSSGKVRLRKQHIEMPIN